MKCKLCGTRNKKSSTNCKFCGNSLSVDTQNRFNYNDYSQSSSNNNESNYSYDNSYSKDSTTSFNIDQNQIFNNIKDKFQNKTNGASSKFIKIFITFFLISFFAPFVFSIVAFFGSWFFINKVNNTEIIETMGTLVSHDNCYYDGHNYLCNATYEYYVDGVTYSITDERFVNISDIEQEKNIMYVLDDPSDSSLDGEYGINIDNETSTAIFSSIVSYIIRIIFIAVIAIIIFVVVIKKKIK